MLSNIHANAANLNLSGNYAGLVLDRGCSHRIVPRMRRAFGKRPEKPAVSRMIRTVGTARLFDEDATLCRLPLERACREFVRPCKFQRTAEQALPAGIWAALVVQSAVRG